MGFRVYTRLTLNHGAIGMLKPEDAWALAARKRRRSSKMWVVLKLWACIITPPRVLPCVGFISRSSIPHIYIYTHIHNYNVCITV